MPIIWAIGLRFALWLEGLIYHRDRIDPRFRKIIATNASWFVLGMGYIVLWRAELGERLHWSAAWKLLLALAAAIVVQRTIRQLRSVPPVPRPDDAPEEHRAAAAGKPA